MQSMSEIKTRTTSNCSRNKQNRTGGVEGADEAPVVKLVNVVFTTHEASASDIHIEHYEEDQVRLPH